MTANPLPLIALLLAALLCSAADGADSASTVVVRAMCRDCNQQRCLPPYPAFGSGVVIGTLEDGQTAVLTAAHVLKDYVSVAICDELGQWQPATVVLSQKNSDFDVALLSVTMPGMQCGYLVESDADADIDLCGYVPGRGWRYGRGRLVVKERRVYGIAATQGESGGPVTRGAAIHGIVWATDGTTSYVTESSRIRLWLRSRLGYIPSCGSPPRPPVVATPGPQPPQYSKPIVVDVPGCDCKNYDSDIAALRAEINAMKRPIEVQIQRDGVVIDRDTYDVFNGQPIVLNFRKKTTPKQSAAGNSGGE